VAWITERKNLFGLFFFFLTFLSYLKFDLTGRRKYYILSGFLFVLALLSKSASVCFVAVPVLYAWWKDGKISAAAAKNTIPFAVVGGIAAVNTVFLEMYRGNRKTQWPCLKTKYPGTPENI
jgi:Gpi18-like mannosyltransferase